MLFHKIVQTVSRQAHSCSVGLGFAAVMFAATNVTARNPGALDVRMELARHGFTPQALTVCGVAPGQAGTVLGYVIDQIDDHWTSVDAARQSLESLKRQRSALEVIVRSGQASSAQVTAYNDLAPQIQSAQAVYDAAFNALDQAMLASLSTEQLNFMQLIRANSDKRVEFKYLVLDLSDTDWAELSGALATVNSYEDIEAPGDNPPPAAAAQVVQERSSTYNVNLAEARLDTHLGSIEAAFESAIASLP